MGWSRRRRWTLGCCAGWLAVCAVGELRSTEPALPRRLSPAAAMVSEPIPIIGAIARHSWLIVRGEGEPLWERWDLYESGGGAFDHVHRTVASDDRGALYFLGFRGTVEWVVEGDEAARFAGCLRREAARYEARDGYRAWPGPNSNSFIDAMLRACELRRPMAPTAIGKDWRGWVGASVTRQGTGVQVESPVLGVAVGLREGLELHPLGLTVGLDPWPPAILVPIGHGRFGFDP